MLRRFLKALSVGAVLASASATAAVPLQMNVQGSLLNADGSPVSGTYSIKFTLYDGSGATATPSWSETIADVAASSGVFDEVLGSGGTPLQASVFTGTNQLWLGITVLSGPGVPNGGQAELPRRPLATVAYAFESHHAVSAGSADNLSCATGCVSLSELGFDVATQAELDASNLLPANSSLDLQCSGGCVSVSELGFDVATQAELDAATSGMMAAMGQANAAIGALTTTVDGHTASLTALAARVTTAEGMIATLAAKVALSDLACAAGQIAVSSGAGVWACGDAPKSTPSAPCVGEYKGLQWDGTDWKCVNVLGSGLSGGKAKAFEAKDSWGFVWDGLERQSGTWQEATAACATLGGRLPTISELWRVSGGQRSEIGNSYETNYLWSRTQWDKGSHARLRLTDGSIDGQGDTNKNSYRCVWSNNQLTYFAGNHCYGNPGTECQKSKVEGARFNFDTLDRPPVPYLSAVDDCSFYGAHVIRQREYAENIPVTGGLPNGSYNWLWTSENNLYYCNQTVRWTGVDPAYTDSVVSPQSTTYNDTRTSQGTRLRFRCSGINYDSGVHPNTIGDQTNPEFVATGVKLKSHVGNKGSVHYWDAITDCFNGGGHVPTQLDYTELIRAGLPNGAGTGSHLWNSDFSRYEYTNGVRWTGTDTQFTGFHSEYVDWFYVGLAASYKMPYRCVYYPIDAEYAGPPKATSCDGSGNFHCCNTGQFKCYGVEKGGSTKIKMWADTVDRGAVNYINAVKACASENGRLASSREMTELIRSGLPNGNGTDYLWTSDSIVYHDNGSHDYALTVRWSNIETSWTPTAENNNHSWRYKHPSSTGDRNRFRCVWSNELRQ